MDIKTFNAYLTTESSTSLKMHPDVSKLVSQYSDSVKLGIRQKNDLVTVDKIVVPEEERGKGIGSRFMRELIAIADRHGLVIALTPSSDFGGSKSRLVKFYKDLGFVENKGSAKDFRTKETFIRDPE